MKKFLVNKKYIVTAANEAEAKEKASLISPELQTKALLEAICNAKGKVLEEIENNLGIDELKLALKKYPEYRSKLPKKIREAVKPVIVTKEADVVLTIKVKASFNVDKEWSNEDIGKLILASAMQDSKIDVKSGSKEVTIEEAVLDNIHVDEGSIKEME